MCRDADLQETLSIIYTNRYYPQQPVCLSVRECWFPLRFSTLHYTVNQAHIVACVDTGLCNVHTVYTVPLEYYWQEKIRDLHECILFQYVNTINMKKS